MVLQLEVRRSPVDLPAGRQLCLEQADLDLVLKAADYQQTDNPLKYKLLRDKDQAWLVVELFQSNELENSLIFSLSQSSPNFGEVLTDTFQATYKLAKLIDADLYFRMSGEAIGDDAIKDYADPESAPMLDLTRQWEQNLNRINAENRAPIEFIVDSEESLAEYFCLELHLTHIPKFEDFKEQAGFSFRKKNESQCAIFDKDTQRPICKLHLTASGVLRVQPFYWKVSFAQAASETMQTAELLQVIIDPLAEMTFFQFPYTAEVRAEIESASKSFGMDFNQWAASYFGEEWQARDSCQTILPITTEI